MKIITEKWDGKIPRAIKKITEINEKKGEESNRIVKIHIILYLATDKAINRIKENIRPFCGDKNYEVDIHCIQKVLPVQLSREEEILFHKHYLKNKKNIVDSHYQKGNMDSPHHGFDDCGLALVIHHNTPNNSFPIIWAGDNALFPRVTRHKDVR